MCLVKTKPHISNLLQNWRTTHKCGQRYVFGLRRNLGTKNASNSILEILKSEQIRYKLVFFDRFFLVIVVIGGRWFECLQWLTGLNFFKIFKYDMPEFWRKFSVSVFNLAKVVFVHPVVSFKLSHGNSISIYDFHYLLWSRSQKIFFLIRVILEIPHKKLFSQR